MPKITKLIQIFEPIVFGLISLETDNPVIHKVEEALNNIETSITYGCIPESIMTCRKEIDFQQKFQSRKKMILKTLHLTAHFQDPYQKGKLLSPFQRIDTLEFISKVADIMGLGVMNDLSDYQSILGIWLKPLKKKKLVKKLTTFL